MLIDEKRNCNCGNMSPNSYMNNTANAAYMGNNNNDNDNDNDDMRKDCCMKNKMLHQIMAYDFAINDLALYLDTHNDDERALCLHNRYCKEAKELKDKYQKVYGPLTIEYPCNKWRWIEEPWPWERSDS